MAANYVTLLSHMIQELGIGAGVAPDTTSGLVGEQQLAAKLIADADVSIQSQYEDWKFMWSQHTGVLTVGSDIIPSPTANYCKRIRKDSMAIHYDAMQQQARPWRIPWPEFERMFEVGTKETSDSPVAWTVRPDRVVLMSTKARTAAPVRYDYYRMPTRMTVDSDTSPIPAGAVDNTVDYPRIIIVRAMLSWGQINNMPEVEVRALGEYEIEFERLKAQHLETMEEHFVDRADVSLVVYAE